MDNLEKFKDSIDGWTEKWEKAQEEGIFDDAPSYMKPSAQTADDASFFGLQNTHGSDSVPAADAEYWDTLHKASGDPSVITETLRKKAINEADKAERGQIANAVGQAPNPIRQASTGEDQDMSPETLGVTYSDEDLDSLAELKKELHALEDKMNTADGLSKNSTKVEKQISNLREKVSELSDSLDKGHEMSQQGD